MCKTIKLKVKFQANPLVIYSLMTEKKSLQLLTGKAVVMDAKTGGRFSNYGGDVVGINVDLLPGKRIVQAWRHRLFPEGIFSMAAFTLASTHDGGTELILTHRGVPKNLIPQISSEWRTLYWEKIKMHLVNTPRQRTQKASKEK